MTDLSMLQGSSTGKRNQQMSEFDSSEMKESNVCEETYDEKCNGKLELEEVRDKFNNQLGRDFHDAAPVGIPTITITSELMENCRQSSNYDTSEANIEKQTESEPASFVEDNVVVMASVEQTDGISLSGEISVNVLNSNSGVNLFSIEQNEMLESDSLTAEGKTAEFDQQNAVKNEEELVENEAGNFTVKLENEIERFENSESSSFTTGDVDDNDNIIIDQAVKRPVDELVQNGVGSCALELQSKTDGFQIGESSFATGNVENTHEGVRTDARSKDDEPSQQTDEKLYEKAKNIKYSCTEDQQYKYEGIGQFSGVNTKLLDENKNVLKENLEERNFNEEKVSMEDVEKLETEQPFFPQHTLPCPRAETVEFIEEQSIIRLFQDLASGIVYERPAKPFEYMLKKLEEMQLLEENKVSTKKRKKSKPTKT